jgi:hypothetical protein
MNIGRRWLPAAACCLAAMCAIDAARAQEADNRSQQNRPPQAGQPPRDDFGARPAGQPPRNQPPREESGPFDGPPPREGGRPRGDNEFRSNVPGFGEGEGPRPFGPRPGGPPMPFGRGGGPDQPGGPRVPAPFDFDDLRQRDPELYELMQADIDLERKALELAASVRRAKGDEQQRLRADLMKAVEQHFDVRQQRRALQLKRMEEELARLREGIEKRGDIRDAIIQQRLSELLGEAQELDF